MMENKRLFLFMGLCFIMLLLWDAWQKDYGVQPSRSTAVSTQGESGLTSQSEDVPSVQTEQAIPGVDAVQGISSVPEAAMSTTVPAAQQLFKSGQRIEVITDVFKLIIDTVGGDIRQVDLLAYPVAVDQPDNPFRIMSDGADYYSIAQSGLVSNSAAPDHHAEYQVRQNHYVMSGGEDSLQVPLYWTDPSGIQVTKTYTFTRGSYVIDLNHSIKNDSSEPWAGRLYSQLQRTEKDGIEQSRFLITYTGGVVYSEAEKYEKIDFSDMEDADLAQDTNGGWAAMIQHYFVSALIPPAETTNHYYTKAFGDGRYAIGALTPGSTIAVGQSADIQSQYYIGPKIQKVLEEVSPGLELTVDYGILTVLSKPLFWLLDYIHSVVGNWGWAIILLTCIIKLVFFKLSEASYKSMANMRQLAPRVATIRERFGDDRQRMSQAMMELYKKEKINPLGGCLPILVQIPVFIALYWVLLESVELRQAPFILWLDDLSLKDPYYMLPLWMGATMFIQQKLNPAPPDPVQAKVLMALPIIFTLFFAFFPSGLVLYWLVNNLLSISQQWYITRRIEKNASRKS